MARIFAIMCMVVWLTGTVGMAVVATQNFFTIDRLIEARAHPDLASAIERLSYEDTRELLRYLSSELNRLYFQYWSLAQLAIGILALWFVTKLPMPQYSRAKWSIVAMLGIVLFLTVAIMPQIISLGRALDFVPRDPPPPRLRTFGILHAVYMVMDLVKLILGILVTIWLQAKESVST